MQLLRDAIHVRSATVVSVRPQRDVAADEDGECAVAGGAGCSAHRPDRLQARCPHGIAGLLALSHDGGLGHVPGASQLASVQRQVRDRGSVQTCAAIGPAPVERCSSGCGADR